MKRTMILNEKLTHRLVAAAIALGLPGVALAANDCSLNSLRGPYVFTASGFNLVTGVAQPKAIIEVIDFKGDGTLAVPSATRSVNGVIGRSPAGGTGTYTVDASCAGTIVFTGGPSFDAVVSLKGDKVWMIQTNTDSVFQGVAESAATDQPCSNETLKGAYALSIGGTRPAPFVGPDVRAFAGQMEQVLGTVIQIFDGKGNFTQVDNVKGTNADCSVTQLVTPLGQAPITSKGVIMDGGKEFRQNTVSPDSFMISATGRKMN